MMQITDRYTEQFKTFADLVLDLHENYVGLAWGIAHREGLEQAIAFCETKIQNTKIMQHYRRLSDEP